MKHVLVILVIGLALLSCSEKDRTITSSEDYNRYLTSSHISVVTSKYFQLWNGKITSDSTQLLSFGNVAGEYTRFFKNTGKIAHLKKAEQALKKAVAIANINKEGYARALARNYISQHRFKEALTMAHLADSIGGGARDTQSLYFDIHMELGNYDDARKYLDSIKNFSDFGYLIRLAKWNDFKGDLDTTIKMMEKALDIAESAKNKTLKLWSYTNLADYYGHAGRLSDSYTNYLKALEIEPNNAYAKKGIAWIVFSHEKNGEEALRILNTVTKNYSSPDYYLLKAEINKFLGDGNSFAANMKNYHSAVQDSSYGEMYNSYNVDYYLDFAQENDKALLLALREIKNRPTPESYSLLAKTYLRMDEADKALDLVENKIIGKTHEPGILLNVAEVYKANQEYNKVKALKHELKEAVYELGPLSKKEIDML